MDPLTFLMVLLHFYRYGLFKKDHFYLNFSTWNFLWISESQFYGFSQEFLTSRANSQVQSLALEPIFPRANDGLHRAIFSKLAFQRASWQHCLPSSTEAGGGRDWQQPPFLARLHLSAGRLRGARVSRNLGACAAGGLGEHVALNVVFLYYTRSYTVLCAHFSLIILNILWTRR